MNSVFWAAVITAILSSTGLWGLVQLVITRRQRKQEAEDKRKSDKREEDAEGRRRDREEDDRRALLAEAQATAQRTALESADQRYGRVHEDYLACRTDLASLREATGLLLGVLEALLGRLRYGGADDPHYHLILDVTDEKETRQVIAETRRHLN